VRSQQWLQHQGTGWSQQRLLTRLVMQLLGRQRLQLLLLIRRGTMHYWNSLQTLAAWFWSATPVMTTFWLASAATSSSRTIASQLWSVSWLS
jgi:hypothetical protein